MIALRTRMKVHPPLRKRPTSTRTMPETEICVYSLFSFILFKIIHVDCSRMYIVFG